MTRPSEKEWIRAKEAADRIGCSPRTIQRNRWGIRCKKLNPQLETSPWMYRLREVLKVARGEQI